MNSFWRRQRLFIDRLQAKLLAINLLYLGALSLVFAAATFGPHVYTLYDRGASPEAQQKAADSMLLLHDTIWPPVVVVALIFFYHSMLYTHRIAGPLYRFRETFEKVRNGDLRARAVIRTPDLLHREAHVLNTMIEATEERVERMADAVDAARVTIQEIKAGSRADSRDVTLGAIERLEARIDAIRGRVCDFRLASSDRRDPPPIAAEPESETDHRLTTQV